VSWLVVYLCCAYLQEVFEIQNVYFGSVLRVFREPVWVRKRSAPSRFCSLVMVILKRLRMSFGNGMISQRKKALPASNMLAMVFSFS